MEDEPDLIDEEEMFWDDSTQDPLHRLAHVACPLGRYIVLICGYGVAEHDSHVVGQALITFESLSLTLLDTINKCHFEITCHLDEESVSRYLTSEMDLCGSGQAGTVMGKNIYLFGGYSLREYRSVNCLSRINFGVNPPLWCALAGGEIPDQPQPSPRDKASMVYWDGQLFVFGGYGPTHCQRLAQETQREPWPYLDDHGLWLPNEEKRGWSNQLLVFDLATNRWSNPTCGGSAPSPRAAHAACTRDHVMYLFGGRSVNGRLNDLYSLDLVSHVWTKVILEGPLPCPRSWMTLTLISDSHVLVVGGLSSESNPLGDAHVIDVSRGRVVGRVYPGPTPTNGGQRLWHTATMGFDGRVYVIGGCSSDIFSERTEIQKQLDRYHVIVPATLYRQCLRVVAELGLVDSDLPRTIMDDLGGLKQITGG